MKSVLSGDICHRLFYSSLTIVNNNKLINFNFKILNEFQVLACFAKNMLLLNFALGTNLSTIIISALKGLNQKNNPNETISISPEEESWIGEY